MLCIKSAWTKQLCQHSSVRTFQLPLQAPARTRREISPLEGRALEPVTRALRTRQKSHSPQCLTQVKHLKDLNEITELQHTQQSATVMLPHGCVSRHRAVQNIPVQIRTHPAITQSLLCRSWGLGARCSHLPYVMSLPIGFNRLNALDVSDPPRGSRTMSTPRRN